MGGGLGASGGPAASLIRIAVLWWREVMFSLGLRSRCVGLVLVAALLASEDAMAQWRVVTRCDQSETRPPSEISDAKPIQPGDPWPTDNRFRWLIGDLRIPEAIGGKPSAGQAVGLQLNCGDGGEAWVDLRARHREARDQRDRGPALRSLLQAVPRHGQGHPPCRSHGAHRGPGPRQRSDGELEGLRPLRPRAGLRARLDELVRAGEAPPRFRQMARVLPAELDVTAVGSIQGETFAGSGTLAPNSVTLLELRGR